MEITFEKAEHIGHAYIISSPEIETAYVHAAEIAMAAVCRGSAPFPCRKCSACIKVLRNMHPDVRVIERLTDDKGKKKKFLSVDQVRSASSDASILPNESSRKVFIFKDGDFMNPEAQNAALKFLEEPPNGAVVIICVTNPSVLLSTVRSRCTELSFASERDADASEFDATAEEYLALASGGDRLALWKWCEENSSLSVQEMTDFCQLTAEKITDMLCGRRDPCGMSADRLMHLENLMEKCITYLKVNTGVKLLFGVLEADTI